MSASDTFFYFEAAAIRAGKVESLVSCYNEEGGSISLDLKDLRERFAEVVPFSDLNFVQHSSVVASNRSRRC